MRTWLIKKLGGHTKKEFEAFKKENKKHFFRKGDQVYVNDPRFFPFRKYYLVDSYNCGNNWYVSTDPLSEHKREIENGVSIDDLFFEMIEHCPSCFQPLK